MMQRFMIFLAVLCPALGLAPSGPLKQSTQTSRREFGASWGAALVGVSALGESLPAQAKGGPKGSLDDTEFQACLSKCVYFCTKPKGQEQRTRGECLPECKKECATTSDQLLTGKAIPK